MKDCNGCHVSTATRKRGPWDVCDACIRDFDERKQEARHNLLLTVYTPGAHLWRIGGSALGDVSISDLADSEIFTIKRPILVEDICQWCAAHKALLSLDPWAFATIFDLHGEDSTHDARDVEDSSWWACPDREMTLIIEDLGVIGEDRWNRRFNHPTLFAAKRRSA